MTTGKLSCLGSRLRSLCELRRDAARLDSVARGGGKRKLYKEEAAGRNAPGRLKIKCREE